MKQNEKEGKKKMQVNTIDQSKGKKGVKSAIQSKIQQKRTTVEQ